MKGKGKERFSNRETPKQMTNYKFALFLVSPFLSSLSHTIMTSLFSTITHTLSHTSHFLSLSISTNQTKPNSLVFGLYTVFLLFSTPFTIEYTTPQISVAF